jgi:hypothetical protein
MAVKHICDRCGSEQDVGRMVLNMAVSPPHKTDDLPKQDQDLCPECLRIFCGAVKEALRACPRS